MKARNRPQSGMTLLIVLLSLGLVLLLVVSYLAGVTSNLGDSDAYASSLNVQQVANSAMQMVLSQIQTGTSGGTTVAWASQPGAIRTYDNAGNALAVYKLYSSSQMIVNTNPTAGGAAFNPQSDWAPTTWATTPGLYTDLNEPVKANGQNVYPILDPAAAVIQSGGTPLVDGCSINAAASPINNVSNVAYMPVQWIYELKDGTMVVPTTATGSVTTIPNASNTNPPVARFAFWTDDETCKLNVNTASEGSYWDTPMMAAPSELYFGRYQPAQHEYQRYPGHPATTCLSPVLWSFWGLPGPESTLQPTLAPTLATGGWFSIQNDTNPSLPALSSTYFQNLFGILPKLVWGGSDMGTQATALNYNSTSTAVAAVSIASASLDSDRLFASTGDFLFGRPTSSSVPRPINTDLSQSTLEQLRFFLTASSKAPDVNMFNQPKICIWPENDTTKNNPSNGWNTGNTVRSPIDQLIAFCSTINTHPYYFVRTDPNNPSGDFGTGSRNQTLYNYLTGLMSQPIPGFGAAFSPTRYTTGQSYQIITEIYDYIRGAINLFDTSDAILGGTSSNTYAFAPGSKTVTDNPGLAQVVPTQITNTINGNSVITKGIGRYPTVKQAVIWFIVKAANQPPVMVNSSGQPIDASGNVISKANSTPTAQSFVINPLHPWTGTAPTTLPAPTFASASPFVLQDVFNPAPPTTKINQFNVYPTLSNIATSTLPEVPALYTGAGVSTATQTHAGLPYLTMLDPATGAYDLPNPRYQGPPTLASGPLPDARTALPYHSTEIQAVFFLDMVNNSVGYVGSEPNYAYEVTGLQAFQANGTALNFPSDATHITGAFTTGGAEQYPVDGPPRFARITTGNSSLWTTAEGAYYSPALTFYSSPVVIANTSATNPTFSFTGGTITVKIKQVLQSAGTPVNTTAPVVQTLTINFPSATFPTPLLPPAPPANPGSVLTTVTAGAVYYPPQSTDDLVPSSLLTLDCYDQLGSKGGNTSGGPSGFGPNYGTTTSVSGGLYVDPASRLVYGTGSNNGPEEDIFLPQIMNSVSNASATSISAANSLQTMTCDTIRSVEFEYGDTRIEACLPSVPQSFFTPHADYNNTAVRSAHTLRGPLGDTEGTYRGGTVQPLTNATTLSYTTSTSTYFASNLGIGTTAATQDRPGVPGSSVTTGIGCAFPHTTSSTDFTNSAFNTIWANGGDFDNANAQLADGPFINKPDEGTTLENVGGSYLNGYFNSFELAQAALGSTLFSPNRMIPSPVMFGSLPAGVDPASTSTALNSSWTTLLFCPNPNSQTHVGLGANPPDYALLDFFHMPVVEPYAISEPLSTSGMVNMNYQIVPFSYIKRDTAVRGVLKSVMLTAIPDSAIYYYKGQPQWSLNFGDDGSTQDKASKNSGYWNYRYPISATQTLMQFDAKFATNDIFRSPSQICSIWLYPTTQPNATTATTVNYDSANTTNPNDNISAWWYNGSGTTRKSLTGTNLRDRPYALLYPRLTTKSNTYTIHVRAQVLRVPTNSGNTLDETTTRTIGEWRGSYLVERYIDPNNTALPDFASNTSDAVDPYYTFRTLSTRRFSP